MESIPPPYAWIQKRFIYNGAATADAPGKNFTVKCKGQITLEITKIELWFM